MEYNKLDSRNSLSCVVYLQTAGTQTFKSCLCFPGSHSWHWPAQRRVDWPGLRSTTHSQWPLKTASVVKLPGSTQPQAFPVRVTSSMWKYVWNAVAIVWTTDSQVHEMLGYSKCSCWCKPYCWEAKFLHEWLRIYEILESLHLRGLLIPKFGFCPPARCLFYQLHHHAGTPLEDVDGLWPSGFQRWKA